MRRHGTPALAALITLALGLALLAGCEKTPDPPVFDNPFDPDGPLGGDGLQVEARPLGNGILVTWNKLDAMGIDVYVVRHRSDPDASFADLASVEAPLNSYIHADPEPDRWNQYEVQGFGSDPETDFTIVGYATPGDAVALPRFEPAEGDSLRASRYLDLAVTVNIGDTLRLADNAAFDGDTLVAVAVLGERQLVGWDFGPATGPDSQYVYLQVSGPGGYLSDVTYLPFERDFAPAFQVVGNPPTVATRLVDLEIPDEGVLAMRFALSEAGLPAQPWQPAAPVYEDFLLAEDAGSQIIYGEFEGDSGYDAVTLKIVRPATLSRADFKLVVPADRVINTREVKIGNDEVATRMRFSESPDFLNVPWLAHADTILYTVSEGAGRKVIYGQFLNDWNQSGITSEWVDYLSAPVSVAFLSPGNGHVLLGGVSLQVRGSASSGTLTTVLDSVRLDLGDGEGWRRVTGTTEWSYTWDVPRFTSNVSFVMRARAWASAGSVVDSATALVNVLVSQLAVAIDEPADGATVAADSTLTIAGTAAPFLGGAVDSVTVRVDDVPLDVSGTASWSAEWLTPVVVADQTFTVTATVWSAGETWSEAIDVTVQAPGP